MYYSNTAPMMKTESSMKVQCDNKEKNEEIQPKGYLPRYLTGRERCVVCADKASGLHYSCLTCEGCKGFFRRTVQKNLHLVYKCISHNQCEIMKTTRNKCRACRYRKCIQVGMAAERVLNEDQRIAMRRSIEYNRLQKKAKFMLMIDPSTRNNRILSDADKQLINNILMSKKNSQETGAIHDLFLPNALFLPPSDQFVALLTKAITQIVEFAKGISLLKNVMSVEELVKILKLNCMNVITFRSVASDESDGSHLALFSSVVVSREHILRTRFNSCGNKILELTEDFRKIQLTNVDKTFFEAILLLKGHQVSSYIASARYALDVILSTFRRYVISEHPLKLGEYMLLLDKLNDIESLSRAVSEVIGQLQMNIQGQAFSMYSSQPLKAPTESFAVSL